MLKVDAFQALNLLREHWYRRSTIIILVTVTSLFLVLHFQDITISLHSLNNILFIIALDTIEIFMWYFSRRLQVTKKNKIGFIIAIYTENEEQHKKLKSDLIEKINDIDKGNYKYAYDIIVYPEYYSKKIINQKVAVQYMKRSKAHYILYGRCRERNINGKQHTVIDMQGAVSHRPIPQNIQRIFSKEFTELLPNRMAFSNENDLFSFEFASDFISIVSRYIIATASFLSGDFGYAKDVYYALRKEIHVIKTNIPSIIEIKKRIPLRLADIISITARYHYIMYKKEKDIKYLDLMKDSLDELDRIKIYDYNGQLLRAILLFLQNGNIIGAIKELNKCKKEKDLTWMFSYAFLKAYSSDLRLAENRYKTAFKGDYDPATPNECEEFINDVIEKEPDKTQLYYCLGLINYYAKEDYDAASRDFQKFIDSNIDVKYIEYVKKAKEYIERISIEK